MALDHIKKVLDPKYKDKKYQKALLLKMAPSLLPRLNEHTGADGVPLFDQKIQEKADAALDTFFSAHGDKGNPKKQ